VLKFVYRSFPVLLVLVLASVTPSKAQGLNVFFGAGTATDSSNGQSYDVLNGGCYTGDPTCLPAPKMTGAFGVFGAQFMLNSHLGIDGEYSFRFSQCDYAGLGYRPTFYDFNAVYQPIGRWSRVIPVLEAGIGGATVHYYYNSQVGPSNVTEPLVNSNHFQLHGAVGVRIYVTNHAFIRPQVDLRYIPNYVDFGSNFVPEYTVAIGYTFGGR
jgi:hypothetical protein